MGPQIGLALQELGIPLKYLPDSHRSLLRDWEGRWDVDVKGIGSSLTTGIMGE